MFTFHHEVEALFRSAGWALERCVAVEPWATALQAQGFILFPTAERIIGSVGGLTVRGPTRAETRWHPRAIEFDPFVAGDGEYDRFEEWQRLVGQRLYPLAGLKPRLCVAVAEDGVIFAGVRNLFYRYGTTFEEAMALYFLGANPIRREWCD